MKIICLIRGHLWREETKRYMSDIMIMPSSIFIGQPGFNQTEYDFLMKIYNSHISTKKCLECGKEDSKIL